MTHLSEVRTIRSPGRIRIALQWLVAPLRPFLVVLVPTRDVPPEVAAGRYGVPLLTAVLCACVAAYALGTRLDVGPAVRAEDAVATATATATEEKPAEIKTDREIDEAIAKRTTVTRVELGLGAVFATPARVFALGLMLLLLGRFIGGTPTMRRSLAVAALATIPFAVRSLLAASVAWSQPSVLPGDLDTLVQFPHVIPEGHPVLARVFAGVDVFTWWSVVIVAIGMTAAAGVRLRKSSVAIAIGFVLFLLVTRLILGGE